MKNSKKNKEGFTLIELIVVMIIIGILVLLATPRFINYIKKAQYTNIIHDIKVLENSILPYYAKHDELPIPKNGQVVDHIEAIREYESYVKEGELKLTDKSYYLKAELNQVFTKNRFPRENPPVGYEVRVNENELPWDFYEIPKKFVMEETRTRLKGNFIVNKECVVIYVDSKGKELKPKPEENKMQKFNYRLANESDKMLDRHGSPLSMDWSEEKMYDFQTFVEVGDLIIVPREGLNDRFENILMQIEYGSTNPETIDEIEELFVEEYKKGKTQDEKDKFDKFIKEVRQFNFFTPEYIIYLYENEYNETNTLEIDIEIPKEDFYEGELRKVSMLDSHSISLIHAIGTDVENRARIGTLTFEEPSNLRTIKGQAMRLVSIKNISLPSSIKNIADNSIQNIIHLQGVDTSKSKELLYYGGDNFRSDYENKTIQDTKFKLELPASLEYIFTNYTLIKEKEYSINELEIKGDRSINKKLMIETWALNIKNLEKISIDRDLINIEINAFNGSSISKFIIGDSVNEWTIYSGKTDEGEDIFGKIHDYNTSLPKILEDSNYKAGIYSRPNTSENNNWRLEE